MRRKHFAKGGRGSEAHNTCTHCGEDINVNDIHESIPTDYGTHHFDKEGEHVATDLEGMAPADTDHYGTHFQPGRHCYDCARTFDDGHLMDKHLDAHYEASRPDTTREAYE